MPGRKYSAGTGYRYGFNGKENDNEVKGEGNQQDYGMRIYDPRIGKFLSVDPLTNEYSELSPFGYSENCPIKFADLDGQESWDPNAKPSGITYISQAMVPSGLMEEHPAFAAGEYWLFKTNGMHGGGDFYTARHYYSSGRYKNMYGDDWIIGPESVSKFIANVNEYEKLASWVHLGENMGGGSFSARGIIDAGKEAWNPQNILFSIALGGRAYVGWAANMRLPSSPEGEIPPSRPTWRESELSVIEENPGYREQVSFINGKEVGYGSKGSVRPELYKGGSSIEVKNYDITTPTGRNRLVNNVVKKVRQRIANLPRGTVQKILLDVRGQNFNSGAELMKAFQEVKSRILTQTRSSSVTVGLKGPIKIKK